MKPTWQNILQPNIKLWIIAIEVSFTLYDSRTEATPLSPLSPTGLIYSQVLPKGTQHPFFLPVHTHRFNFWVNACFEKNIGVRIESHRLPLYAENNRVLFTVICECVHVFVCCALDAVSIPKSPPTQTKPHPLQGNTTPSSATSVPRSGQTPARSNVCVE